jgi:hypothetical protein
LTTTAIRLIRFCGAALVVLELATCVSCARPSPPTIQLNAGTGTVEVSGLPSSTLAALARGTLTDAEWQALLRVSVKQATGASAPQKPPVAGKYVIAGSVLRFTPMFAFDAGRQYDVVLDPSRLPDRGTESWRSAPIAAVVGTPAVPRSPSTVVSAVFPSGDAVPANQLRLYILFSAPMDWRSGYDYVKLLDDQGKEVVDPFLPLDADFWSADRTRYTVFYDPGRVKRGILPNRQMGRALETGKRYTLVVRRDWHDEHGLPLKEEFRREFRVTPPIERPLTIESWKVSAPQAATRAPLTVEFPAALDRGLLARALGVSRAGTPLAGEVAIDADETRWRFTPAEPWQPGDYQLVALSILEDVAGNRIGRAFEVDRFERTDRSPEPERHLRPFRIAAPTSARR